MHLESLQRQTGEVPDLLADAVPEPEFTGYLWGYYCLIRQGIDRKAARPIAAQDVQDFCWFYAVQLDLWERIALKQIDAAFMETLSD